SVSGILQYFVEVKRLLARVRGIFFVVSEVLLGFTFVNCASSGQCSSLALFGLRARVADCVDIVDVPATEVWSRLAADASSVLIDVRTRAEWMFVGLPDISALNRRAWTIEWQSFPDGRVDPGFAEKLSTLL